MGVPVGSWDWVRVVVEVVAEADGALAGREALVGMVEDAGGLAVGAAAPMVTAGRGCGAGSAKLPTETVRTAAAPSPANVTAGTRKTGLSITPPSRTWPQHLI